MVVWKTNHKAGSGSHGQAFFFSLLRNADFKVFGQHTPGVAPPDGFGAQVWNFGTQGAVFGAQGAVFGTWILMVGTQGAVCGTHVGAFGAWGCCIWYTGAVCGGAVVGTQGCI